MKFDRNTRYTLLQSQFQTTFTIEKVKIECCFSFLGLLIVGREVLTITKVHAKSITNRRKSVQSFF